jgi:hypothetical protein
VKFDKTKTSASAIEKAIKSTGYEVKGYKMLKIK